MTALEPFVAVDAFGARLPHAAVPAEQVVEGSPTTGLMPLGELGGARLGLWEMTAGTMRDIEIDEVFVVLEGEALLVLLAGSEEIARIELRPGVVVRLAAGSTTRWTVGDRLRKLYVAAS